MANNRMYLECTTCAQHVEIAVIFVSGYYVNHPEERGRAIAAFVDAHQACSMLDEHVFRIRYEIEFDAGTPVAPCITVQSEFHRSR